MDVLITDITEMHRGNYCVAGWCAASEAMVRPLLQGSNWTAPLIAQHGVEPGATVRFNPINLQANSAYPHRTEDTNVSSATTLIHLGPINWFDDDAPPLAATLADVFENNVMSNSTWKEHKQGVHVLQGTQTVSLGAVAVNRKSLKFYEDDSSKLRVKLNDGSDRYSLAVSARLLKETFQEHGIQAVNDLLPPRGKLHVRVGLARTWEDEPNKCYVMVNGVYW